MAFYSSLFLALFALLLVRSSNVTSQETVSVSPTIDISINRNTFPQGFIFGAGSSSYQFEGAAMEGGRGESVWDTFTHKYPAKIQDRSNGDVAIDSYHHYKEDVKMMKDVNLDSYRFSISWSRILPKGKLSGGINQEGINYYNNLINELVANGIKPFVTLFHWDLPQALEDEYGGFLSPLIVKDFRDYAELCFKEFGDRVKYWVTLNEPWSYSQNGYASGEMAPGRCSAWMNSNCTGGDSSTEPYLVTHHQLLAHAAAVRLYKAKYQTSQEGVIGITLVANWFLPLRDTKADKKAAERAIDFMYGWFMDPLTSGDYPKSMRSLVRTRLPKFTADQARQLIGSFDFIGLNYYSTTYSSDAPQLSNANPSYITDSLVTAAFERDGKPIGIKIASDWLYVYPRGIRDLLLYTKDKYNNPLIYITENGVNEYNEPSLSLEESLMDTFRIDYHYRHLYYLLSAIRNGANVKGYYVWSFFDNFEWSSGYTSRFGMVFIDYKNGLKRYPKLSAMCSLFLALFALLLVRSSNVTSQETVSVSPTIDISINRNTFPQGFIFGAGSSSYQFEGAAMEGGRGESVWDTFTHKYPAKIQDRSNGDVAIDSYHHYKEDVKMMKDVNLDSYRFSISWSRILPKGKLSGGINQEGINYYNNLINELVANDIKPFVTLFHWDLPQALEDEYGGFLSPLIVKDFRDYAELCFKEFGDRVKYWVTLNEPWSYSQNGYASGEMAPGRCSAWMNSNCTGGDSSTEPYLVTHHQLLAHAAAVRLYKAKYQTSQEGVIGITLVANWFLPLRDTKADQKAAERAIDFMYGWFMDPLTSGDYPKSMRSLVRTRLPKFTADQARQLIGSFDFIGLNYYSTTYSSDAPQLSNANPSYITDSLVTAAFERDGKPIGIKIASDWLYVYPRGIRDLLLYTKDKYNNPLIYITENGVNEYNEPSLSLEESLMDTFRIDYHYRHLYYLLSAIRNGANVKGYYVWSFFDNFEWSSGYTSRFGMVFIDYKNGLKRYPKLSAMWYKNFLKKETRLYASSK
ncbi:lactase-phlorizin hydrolase [Vigna unguiculata]|uniref:Lactase-phlorizin hydrolase n=2 Tax=Vigna unguiculata TaxID=3917 RepID=A0A4D6LIU6_VIGUN|nr:lactase-phlorizin hydrolase [Vigna unguiculata]